MPKEQSDPVIENWFQQILKLKPGEVLTIPCTDVASAKSKARNLNNLRKRYTEFNPAEASQVQIGKAIVVDGRFVVRCSMTPFAQLSGFVQSEAGATSVTIDPERERTIHNMLKDNMKKEEITSILQLTKEEVKLFFG